MKKISKIRILDLWSTEHNGSTMS